MLCPWAETLVAKESASRTSIPSNNILLIFQILIICVNDSLNFSQIFLSYVIFVYYRFQLLNLNFIIFYVSDCVSFSQLSQSEKTD